MALHQRSNTGEVNWPYLIFVIKKRHLAKITNKIKKFLQQFSC